jgi:toxin-antitoxin system PIN domain toxin
MYLPDVNVWLALAWEEHDHHSAAEQWFESISNDRCYFCRLTQQGLLRLVTTPSVMRNAVITLEDAWRMWDKFLRDPRIGLLPEPEDLTTRWRSYTSRKSFSPRIWNDGYLAAFASAANLRLVTFDLGLRQYPNLNPLILT